MMTQNKITQMKYGLIITGLMMQIMNFSMSTTLMHHQVVKTYIFMNHGYICLI